MLSGDLLLGRERESAVLNETLSGQGSALLVLGEAGIGKSALLAAARSVAQEAGCTVLRATGVESETHLPFGGLHQVITPLMRHHAALSRRQRDAIATALGLTDAAAPDLFLIAEAALAMVLLERADRPVVLVVDDVQWLDPPSHQIVVFLAHRAAGVGISVVGAMRSGHAGPLADAGFAELHLEGVDDDTAAAILRAQSAHGITADLARVRREAQGNPLALWELPRSRVDGSASDGQPRPLSATLERAFAGRIAELPAGSRTALLVAAVASSSDADEIRAAASKMGSPVSDEDLDLAASAGLITVTPSRIDFRHPLVRSGILQRETMTRRHAAHAALAEVLIADRYRATWHRAWSIVGPDDDIADAVMSTVSDSLRRGAVMSAVASLERAAQLTSASTRRGERLLQAADNAFQVGRADVLTRLLREAGQLELSELDELRLVWLTEVANNDVQANSALVRRLCASARRAAAAGDEGLALNLLSGAALRCWWADSGADDRAEVVRVLDGLPRMRADPRHLVAVAIAEPVLRGSEVLCALQSMLLDDVHDGDSLRVRGMAAYGVGDLVLATDLLDRAEASFRADGRLGMLPVVLALQLHIRLDLGDWSGSVLAGEEVRAISRETGQALFAENNVLVEARATALRGDPTTALDMMAVTEADALALRINDRICFGYHARGAALLSADRPDEAFECLRRQYDPADPGYHLRESFAAVALMAEAAVSCGRIDEARTITEGLETVAVITPSPLLEVNLLYARAVLSAEEVRDERYRDALTHDLSRWPWLRARIQLAYGQWLIHTQRYGEASDHLHAATDVFRRLGALRWERCAGAALDVLRRSAPDAAGPDGRGPQ